MKRATITIGDDLEKALRAYIRQQEVRPALASVVQAALREYLAGRGLAASGSKFSITPAKRGSGKSDVSDRHDRYVVRHT